MASEHFRPHTPFYILTELMHTQFLKQEQKSVGYI